MNISRRQFCKKIATGATLLSTGTLFSACGGVTRKDLNPTPKAIGYIFGLDQRDEQILLYASLAPSILNTQPWFVRIVDRHQWIIGIDQSRLIPAIDPDNREILLSIGAFVENLSIASAAKGLRADIEIIANSSDEKEIVRVNFKFKPPVAYPLERLERRRTIKKGFSNKELTLETEYALSAPLKDHFFYFPKGTEHASCIRDGVIEQYRNQLNRNAAQKEIITWIRLSDNDAIKNLDGLTPACMEIDGISGWYLRHFAVPANFLKSGYRDKSLEYTKELAQEGAGWIIITSKGKDIASLIETGRRFQQMALIAKDLNVAIHPMSQYLEEKSGMDQFHSSHVTSFFPQFILRIGYINCYPPPVSFRRPLHWFVRT